MDTFVDIKNRKVVLSYRSKLLNKSGIYSFICILDGLRYIGSSNNFYKRLLDHLAGRKRNLALQRAFSKYGKDNFKFVIYSYSSYSLPSIIDLETFYISYFPLDRLYNFTSTATSMYGYRHTDQAIQKMKNRFQDITNHPMFGKTHTPEAKALISKPGSLNPRFGITLSSETREKISAKLSTPVSLYDKDMNYILTFKNNTELAFYIECHKVTIGRYLKSGKLYQNRYYFRSPTEK